MFGGGGLEISPPPVGPGLNRILKGILRGGPPNGGNDVAQQRDDPSLSTRIIDTRGDEPFTATYVAVVVFEVAVLVALWLFSRHFLG